jgi:polyhydroxybutyrate depolymerase
MRLSYVFGSALLVAVATVFACSSESNSGADAGTSGGPVVPEGGTILPDGAVVDSDGRIVDQPDTSTPPKPSKVNATVETIDVLGQSRNYVLTVPKTYDGARKYPLILALHGDGQDGANFRSVVNLDDIAGDDAIVAYPTMGPGDLFTPYDQNADQQLPEAVSNAVKAKFSIDDRKVWGFGYSKGGFMLHQIACRKPGVVKAMAVHASGKPQDVDANGYPNCPGVSGLPVLATEGDLNTDIGAVYGAQYWAAVDGCGGSLSATTPAPCQKFDGCPGSRPVVYCLAPGVSHYPMWSQAESVSWGFFQGL